jgi:prepilin peptidase CpaA
MLDALALSIFIGLLLYGAYTDVRSLTIPNWVSIALAAAFPIAALAGGASVFAIAWHLGFGLCILAIGFFLFQGNIIGGGDAKLLAATAVWTGSMAFLPFIFWTALCGGVLALILIAARQFLPTTNTGFMAHLLQKQNGIPYGLAIFGGAVISASQLPFLF